MDLGGSFLSIVVELRVNDMTFGDLCMILSWLIMLGMLSKNFNRRQFAKYFFLFIPEDRFRHFTQIISSGDCMKCQSLFSGKNKKTVNFVVS